ncbi:hypothetical protein [Microbacterium ulmi]|uniref:ECF transporter S component n=1 Tax=Microbacterium ulmi TaxID=179095 RepID=A0A7Y2M0I8_9MICO|nr:hypothetical protein [Microbacterium ulmi]NII70974.1 hypothetical protein [Microbacterium ulmi]NNH04260.1 hypothetical protein [Microbacterium ulmi]
MSNTSRARATAAPTAARGMNVKKAIWTALLGALGCILTMLAIPIGPNISINLYVISGILVGATCGALLGALGGFLGALYTPVLWGWFGALPYNAILGFGAGLATRFGLRPSVGVVLAYIVAQPIEMWMAYQFLGMPWAVQLLGVGSTILQAAVAVVITEAIISVPQLRKRLPRTGRMTVPAWVDRVPFLRHPWADDYRITPVAAASAGAA